MTAVGCMSVDVSHQLDSVDHRVEIMTGFLLKGNQVEKNVRSELS